MKMFECIIIDGGITYAEVLPGKSKKEMLAVWGGNGEFKSVKDVTSKYFSNDSANRLMSDLGMCGWGTAERRLIGALLDEHIKKSRKSE